MVACRWFGACAEGLIGCIGRADKVFGDAQVGPMHMTKQAVEGTYDRSTAFRRRANTRNCAPQYVNRADEIALDRQRTL
jgi:hypothetical protein